MSEQTTEDKPQMQTQLAPSSGYAGIVIKRAQEKKYPTQPGMIAEETLVPQLATFPDTISETGRYDDRILSKINKMEALWMSIIELIPAHGGGRMWRKFGFMYRMMKRSEGGWTSQNIIKALGSLRGTPTQREIARKPNVLARNLWNRDWKEKAVEEGKDVVQE